MLSCQFPPQASLLLSLAAEGIKTRCGHEIVPLGVPSTHMYVTARLSVDALSNWGAGGRQGSMGMSKCCQLQEAHMRFLLLTVIGNVLQQEGTAL